MKGETAGAESLLSYPSSSNSGTAADEVFQRTIDLSKIEIHKDYSKVAETRKFQRQYAHSYTIRLWSLTPVLRERIKDLWESKRSELKQISDLCESKPKKASPGKGVDNKRKRERGEEHDYDHEDQNHGQQIAFRDDVSVAIIGTIFKQQPLKPSILQELGEEINVNIIEPKEKYISTEDVLLFEDETSRVKLLLKGDCGISVDGIVNGVVCALQGKPTVDGRFEVYEVIWPTPPDPEWPMSNVDDRTEIIFVSGLNYGKNSKSEFELEMLFDYLQGLSGCHNEHQKQLSQKRVFFLGNLFVKGSEKNIETFTALVNKLDEKFYQLALSMEVFVVPDLQDPVPPMLPQPYIHKSILPKSWSTPTFHSLTNPAKLTIDLTAGKNDSPQKIELILTGGCNVKDAMKNTDIVNPVEMGQKILQWGHLCPTAPDTLPLFPGAADDPFIITGQLPNVFAFGNQSQYGSSDWRNTKIISVPEFSETCQVVVFNKNFEVSSLHLTV